ncbi:hypothetical protein [Flavobacterium sp.]|jgi:hypothetical protein|uniref:hypothetical protein n=1 Tax=Flavobacterium sp. TaxID=239 RepID=UPI0040478B59
MEKSLQAFLNYYNDFIKQKGYEPSAYDVNFWIINYFNTKKVNKAQRSQKMFSSN